MEFTTILTPIVGAVIGYTTNWVAIKMLFRPYYEKRILGVKIPFTPGIFPKERERVAKAMGQVVENFLLTEQVILDELTSEQVKLGLRSYIELELSKKNHELRLSDLWKNEEEVSEFINQTTEYIFEATISYINKNDLKEKIEEVLKQNKSSMDQEELAEEPSTLKMVEVLTPKMALFVEELINKSEPQMKAIILTLLENEKFSLSIKQGISEYVSKKFGALGSMFANPESIYNGILDTISIKLEEGNIAKFINDMIQDLDLKTYIKMLPEEKSMIHVIEEHQESSIKVLKPIVVQMFNTAIKLNPEFEQKMIDKIISVYENIVHKYAIKILKQASLSQIVTKQINTFPVKFLEEMILTIAKKELRAITWLGGLLGLIMSIILLTF